MDVNNNIYCVISTVQSAKCVALQPARCMYCICSLSATP